jgi:hypothetical protein
MLIFRVMGWVNCAFMNCIPQIKADLLPNWIITGLPKLAKFHPKLPSHGNVNPVKL